jgi:hypothetical protein
MQIKYSDDRDFKDMKTDQRNLDAPTTQLEEKVTQKKRLRSAIKLDKQVQSRAMVNIFVGLSLYRTKTKTNLGINLVDANRVNLRI